jgi:hypothetical protein
MVDFFDQHFVVSKRRIEAALLALPLYGHADDVGGALQERYVLFRKVSL